MITSLERTEHPKFVTDLQAMESEGTMIHDMIHDTLIQYLL